MLDRCVFGTGLSIAAQDSGLLRRSRRPVETGGPKAPECRTDGSTVTARCHEPTVDGSIVAHRPLRVRSRRFNRHSSSAPSQRSTVRPSTLHLPEANVDGSTVPLSLPGAGTRRFSRQRSAPGSETRRFTRRRMAPGSEARRFTRRRMALASAPRLDPMIHQPASTSVAGVRSSKDDDLSEDTIESSSGAPSATRWSLAASLRTKHLPADELAHMSASLRISGTHSLKSGQAKAAKVKYKRQAAR